MIRIATLCLALLIANPALAVGIPVEVTADTFVVDQDKNVATFTGNVLIKRAGMDLRAANVVVTYGTGGPSDIDKLTATGGVRINTNGQQATGERAVFDPDAQVVTLSGNVSVTSAQGTLKGPELTIDLRTNKSTFKGSEGGRVTGVFTPQ